MTAFDLLVIGGGINGVGIARDAAGRGLKVLLVEKDDLASHTSSWSTKLIHGGLRYLEHREFRLVRESLKEREVLLEAAPYLIRPLRFVLPHHGEMRPRWMLRAGLFIYDHLGGRKHLEGSTAYALTGTEIGACLKDQYTHGYEYTDCQTDDSRLVVVNALDARDRGADIRTRTEFVSAERAGDAWAVEIRSEQGAVTVRAKAIVNASGPWVTSLFDRMSDLQAKKKLRLVKGSHLILKQLYSHDRAYIFQNGDGRIVFTIPYHRGTTLVGTTDEPFEGDPASASISDDETRYLLASINEYFETAVTEDAVLGSFSGVRPLYDELGEENASAVTRDYAFDIDDEDGLALLSVYGGKLTTYRRLAEHAVDKLSSYLGEATGPWTETAALPGGQLTPEQWRSFEGDLIERFPSLPEDLLRRWAAAYGTRVDDLLAGPATIEGLGQDFGCGLYSTEVDFLIEQEWAQSAEDILFRRMKLGMFMSEHQIQQLETYLLTCNALSGSPATAA